MRKVLVTGGCGFLGSHVCQLFQEQGWRVTAFDNLTKFEYDRTGFDSKQIRDHQLERLCEEYVYVTLGDVRNFEELRRAAEYVDLIINCAAQPAMTIAIEDPMYDFEVNVRGLMNVLEVARAKRIPIIHCSTIHVYGNDLNQTLFPVGDKFYSSVGALTEEAPLMKGFISPLHASKRAGELYVEAYAKTKNMQAATFRLTGLYGPEQFGGEDHGWIANFAIRAVMNRPITVFGTDLQVRDALYVEDAARAFLDWYNNGCNSGTFNICGGSQTAISIRQVISLLGSLTHAVITPKEQEARQGDLWWFVGNYSKAKETFKWQPYTLPPEGIKKLVEWVRQYDFLFRAKDDPRSDRDYHYDVTDI